VLSADFNDKLPGIESPMAVLTATLASLPRRVSFKAYDCSNSSNPVEMDSLLDPEPCSDVAMNRMVERTLQGEKVQMKMERMTQITLCCVVEMITSQYCGWKSRAAVVRYLKFREPYTKEPAACCLANKTSMIVMDKKSYPVQQHADKSHSKLIEGTLDLGHNCQVGSRTHEGIVLDCQVTQTIQEVFIRQEWAKVNEVSGMIITTSGLIAPVTDQSLMDIVDGTYAWKHLQEDLANSIMQLYLGSVKVLTNTSTSFV
jgi:hypothetical protein